VVLDFAYDGGGAGKGGKATLSVNGKPVAEGIGIGAETRFTGTITKITLEVRK